MKNDQNRIIKDFQQSYEKGYRCVYYETDEKDKQFTVYLKNFSTENTKVLKCSQEEGAQLKNYINEISQ
ncbi:hypothetical protein [Alkaliphilus hydrothermalis]|uniref:Uncharacterized protein n=1 Tax=Alkaliphilus hydrothermalis TaxID=1482730 RepID=A0ABS2NU09_9FIRM|nr:hypothetical protein [Alkaliphilus hydrothermalis]MBM7616445.1 hypothetical protein [Alkaliphilus hydrothermalis]